MTNPLMAPLTAPTMPHYDPAMSYTAQAVEDSPPDNRVRLPASTAATLSEDTTVLFELDGREYRVATRPRAAVALRYLRAARTRDQAYASAQLLTDLLGTDGFDALCDYEDLTPDQLKQIMQAAQRLVLGGMEEAFGGNSPGSKR